MTAPDGTGSTERSGSADGPDATSPQDGTAGAPGSASRTTGASDSPGGGPGDAPSTFTGGPGWASAGPATVPPSEDRPYPSVPRPTTGEAATTVLPTGGRTAAAGTRDHEPRSPEAASSPAGGPPQPTAGAAAPAAGVPGGAGPARPTGTRDLPARPARTEPRPAAGSRSSAARPAAARSRRARLALKRVDPWSVFVFSLVASVFVAVAVVVAAAALYAVLGAIGVTDSVNQLFGEVTGANTDQPLLTSGRIVGGAAVLGAVNIVFLTLLATLSALLYNLCASFTGGVEVTLGERD